MLLIGYGAHIGVKDNNNRTPIVLVNNAPFHRLTTSFLADLHTSMVRAGILRTQTINLPRFLMPSQYVCLKHLLKIYKSTATIPFIKMGRTIFLDQSACDNYGNTILHVAARDNCFDCIHFLLTHGLYTSINKKNKWGNTPLYLACKKRYVQNNRTINPYALNYFLEQKFKTIQLLLGNGADIMSKDHGGNRLYDKIRDPQILSWLTQKSG